MILRAKYFGLFIFTVFLLNSSCKIEPNEILVDESIIQTVKEKLAKTALNANSVVELQLFEKDSLINTLSVEGQAFSSWFDNGDLAITCGSGIGTGFGFSIFLSEDTNFVVFQNYSDSENIYFQKTNNSEPIWNIDVDCDSYRAILSQTSPISKGTIIDGFVQLESNSFFAVYDGNIHQMHVTLKSYFRSEPLPIKDGGKTFKKLVK